MSDYNSNDIRILDAISHIRMRSGMYIGSTENPIHLFQEVLSNSIDEHLNGHGNCIEVELAEDESWVSIQDHARGIPVGIHAEAGIPTVTAIFTQIYSGGKFGGASYGAAAGLNGVGVTACCALSARLQVVINRDGATWQEIYSRGLVLEPLTKTAASKTTGTYVRIEADPEIFTTTSFDREVIIAKLKDLSYLVPNCKFIFRQLDKELVFQSNGLNELLAYKLGNYKKRAERIAEITTLVGSAKASQVDLSFVFTNSEADHFLSYVNCLRTIDGGTHETAIKKIFFGNLQKYFVDASKFEYTLDELYSGVWVAIHFKTPNIAFSSQTKEKLTSKTAHAEISDCIEDKLIAWLKANQETLRKVFTLAQQRYLAKKQSAKLEKLASKIQLNLKNKPKRGIIKGLADCKSTEVTETELFLLEGQSAAGTARQARNVDTQAILPLQGKVPNAYRNSSTTILKNEEFKGLLNALGCGFGKTCDPALMRYGRIYLLCDSDPDGAHIESLLCAFFLTYLQPLVEQGMIYVVNAPLFVATKGSERHYAKTLEELEDKINGSSGWNVVRMKGWGECSAEDLCDIALNPDTRDTSQLELTTDSVRLVSALMGDDSGARKLLL